MTTNPYAPPIADGGNFLHESEAVDSNQAGRLTRLVAAMADGLILMAVFLPIQLLTGYFERVQSDTVGIVEEVFVSLLGMGVMLLVNGYVLATRGQTIGKMLTKIQIVDAQSSALLPFVNVFVYRYLWTLPITLVVILIPGSMDDFLLNIAILVDISMIFGSDRRCLHDYIAGSRVLTYRAERNRSL